MNAWLKPWVGFLFGTPKRTLVTLGVLLVVFLVIQPHYGEILVSRLMIALTPFIQFGLLMAIIWFGGKHLLMGASGGPKKKGK